MHFLEYYYKKIIKYDLINKFKKVHLKSIPKLQKIVLNFSCINSETIKLLATSFFLELISAQNILITSSNKSNIIIKIKKGSPTGCKVILKEKLMYQFFFKFLTEILPNIKNFKKLTIKKQNLQKAITYSIEEPLLIFSELKEHYYLFNNKISKLDIAIITNSSKSQKEFIYLMKSFKLPIDKSN